MSWQEAVATVIVCLGLFAGAFLFARRPAFWIEFGIRIFSRVSPHVWRYLSKRMTKEEEEAYLKEYRAGRGDEWLRRRRGGPRRD